MADDARSPESPTDPDDPFNADQSDEFEAAQNEISPPDKFPSVASEDDFASQLAEVEKFERNVAGLAHSARFHDIESEAWRAETHARAQRRRNLIGWLALAACVTVFVGGGYEYRKAIVTTLPAAAALYEALGLDINIRGMEFANVELSREFENGLPVLTVRGEVVNVSERTVDVPRIRLGLRDSAMTEIYHWTMAVGTEPLAPYSRAKFATKLAAPPPEANNVVVRFHDRLTRRAALSP